MEIQTAVHKIYQQLSVTLERALQANKHHIGNREYRCASPVVEPQIIQMVKYTCITKFCDINSLNPLLGTFT